MTIIQQMVQENLLKMRLPDKVSAMIYHDMNLGKGAAIQSGLDASTGEYYHPRC